MQSVPIVLQHLLSFRSDRASDALPDFYPLAFDPADDVVTIWTRDGGKRLRRMIAEVQERGIAPSTAF